MTRICLLIALLVFNTGHAASPAPVAARNGMVVTAQHYATRIGVDVLRNGGNAIDAAIAVGYALAVVYPAAGNLGGGGFMTVQFADGRRTFIDFRETAPLAATANMFLDASGNVIPNASTRGHLAVAVPSTVAGLEYVREKYGTLPRARLIAPAIRLAEQGFVLEQGDADMLREATDDFRKDKTSAAIFLQRDQPFEPGATLVQKDLARTLRNISSRGASSCTL
jgi:gamma-glutamyltranspeptidase / glutathione hydrolase